MIKMENGKNCTKGELCSILVILNNPMYKARSLILKSSYNFVHFCPIFYFRFANMHKVHINILRSFVPKNVLKKKLNVI